MIVDFPDLKAELNEWLRAASREQIRSSPFLRMIRRHIQHEGDGLTYSTMDGDVRTMNYDLIEETVSTTPSEMAAMSRQEVLKMVLEAGESVARQATQNAFDTLNREIDAVGNTVASSDPTNPEAFLAVLERVHIDFDDSRDKPQMPTLVCHPSKAAELQQRWEALSPAERSEYERRKQEILDRKYAEYVSRENRRALVD